MLHRPSRGLTFQVFDVEVFKLPLDLTEQVQQIAPQRQRQLGVLQGDQRRRELPNILFRVVYDGEEQQILTFNTITDMLKAAK